jgi:hypothetical protein
MKATMYYKMALVAVFLVNSCFLSSSSLLAYTGTITDYFTAPSLNKHLWEGFFLGTGPTIAQTSGQLQINIPANSQPGPPYNNWAAGVKSKFILIGDFDVQVDFSLINWPANDAVHVSIVAFLVPPSAATVGSVDRIGADGSSIPSEEYATNLMGNVSIKASGDLSGTLRMVKIGNLLATFYLDHASNTWVSLGTLANPAFLKNTTIYLFAVGDPGTFGQKAALVAFDNFRVQYTQVFWNMPPILDLLLLSD